MNTANIGSTSNAYLTPAVQRTPEAAEVKKAGRDNDGDSDDGGAKAVKAAPAPTVNTSGQKIGSVINVSA